MIITGSVQLGVSVYTVWPYFHPEVQLELKPSDLPQNTVEDQHMSSSQKHWLHSNGPLKLKLVADSSGPPIQTLPLLSVMGSVNSLGAKHNHYTCQITFRVLLQSHGKS